MRKIPATPGPSSPTTSTQSEQSPMQPQTPRPTQPPDGTGLQTRTSAGTAPRSSRLLDQISTAIDRANENTSHAADGERWMKVDVAIQDALKVVDSDSCADFYDRTDDLSSKDWNRIEGKLRLAFDRPQDSPVTDSLGDMMRLIPGLNSGLDAGDKPMEAVYFVRGMLDNVDAGATPTRQLKDSLNRLALETLNILPQLVPREPTGPASALAAASTMMSLPTLALGVAGAMLPRDTVDAAARRLTTSPINPRTADRTINLVVEAMKKLPQGELSDELAQRITQHIVGSLGGNKKHLGKLHDEFVEKATATQLSSHRPQLQAAGWA